MITQTNWGPVGVRNFSAPDGGARNTADHWDDMICGVDTLNDPGSGGTTRLSNLGRYRFTDGFGIYRTTDHPNYTPKEAGEVGSWTPMTAAPQVWCAPRQMLVGRSDGGLFGVSQRAATHGRAINYGRHPTACRCNV